MAQLSSNYPTGTQEGATAQSSASRSQSRSRWDAIDTIARPLGIVLLLGALIGMVGSAYMAAQATESRNDRISVELDPLTLTLTQLDLTFQSTISDLRALALTDSQDYSDRYVANSAQLRQNLDQLEAAPATAYEPRIRELVREIEEWVPFADTLAAAAAQGDRGPAGRLATLESQPRVDEITAEISSFREDIRTDVQSLRAERGDLARLELAVIVAATIFGAVAGLLLLWLAAAADRRLRESRLAEARLASMVNSITRYGVYELDSHGNLQYVSASAMSILGYQTEEFDTLGTGAIAHRRQDGSDIPPGESPEYRAWRDGETYRGEDAFLRKDGTLMPANVTVEPINVDGQAQGAVVVFEDITKTIEIERFRAQFLAYASHELRTPITIISGFTGILRRRIAAKPKLFDQESRDAIVHMDVAAARIRGIAETVLDLTRLMSGYPLQTSLAQVDVGSLVGQEVAMTREQHPEVEIHYSAIPIIEIHTAPERLRQVIANLLSNAVKYGGGKVIVRITVDDENVAISVRDNGAGIRDDERQLVFQQFYRSPDAAHESGTGIGLFISRQIAWALKGTLTVDSEEGQGAEFVLELPLAGAVPTGAIQGPPTRTPVRT